MPFSICDLHGTPAHQTPHSSHGRAQNYTRACSLLQGAPLVCPALFHPANTYCNFHLLERDLTGKVGGGGSQTISRSTRISNIHCKLILHEIYWFFFNFPITQAMQPEPVLGPAPVGYFAMKRHTTVIRILQTVAAGNLGAVGGGPGPISLTPHTVC